MTQNDDDRFNTTFSKVVDAAFDHGFVSERKQRFEGSHAARLAGGEENCCYFIHSELTTRHKDTKFLSTSARVLWLSLKISQGAQGVLSRHLLAPLIDEVSVIEWSSFNVSGFGSSMDLIVGEWLSDQALAASLISTGDGAMPPSTMRASFTMAVVGWIQWRTPSTGKSNAPRRRSF